MTSLSFPARIAVSFIIFVCQGFLFTTIYNFKTIYTFKVMNIQLGKDKKVYFMFSMPYIFIVIFMRVTK